MRDRSRPKGLTRILLRAPILLYRLKLGWILGKRFLRLTHTGRKSSLQRDTVLEVVDHEPEEDVFMVIAAWGERSDWFQNVMRSPNVMVQVGLHSWPASAERLNVEETRRALHSYARAHATAFRSLSKVLGFESQDNESSVDKMANELPMIALRPRSPVAEAATN